MSSAINVPFYLFFLRVSAGRISPSEVLGSDITLRELFVIQLNAIKCLIQQPLLGGFVEVAVLAGLMPSHI
ncbi:hypothetical protein CGU37_13510 [Pseudomonas fluorescens]|nr:hypothetical protein CGU36_14465 [Pseudomonas fluorescens]OZO48812.1 hypothetical protein CGU37_13510 [Pseudomonas fluorescens]